MPIYKPSELNKYLEELGISPKKRLSQNFLLDRNILQKIAALADLKPGDLVVEVGPGPGALTETLLEAGAKVLAVEKDPILAKGLKRLETGHDNLRVYCDDILTFPIEEEVSQHLAEGQKAKVIANLPYHLTTPIMARLIPQQTLFSHLVVMVQEEVARRCVAGPGTKDYSSLSLFLRYYSKPSYGFRVSRNCFFPKPKVESAVVRFDVTAPPAVSDEKAFFKMTRTAFGQRRKMLRTSLRSLYESSLLQGVLENAGKNPKVRPEELSLDDFLILFEELERLSPQHKQ